MRVFFMILAGLSLFTSGLMVGIEFYKPPLVVEKPRLAMELIGVTPHGHQVYMLPSTLEHNAVYVLIRAADGYPIAIAE